jgi:hypothetical protein
VASDTRLTLNNIGKNGRSAMPHRSTAPNSLPTPLHAAVVISLAVFFSGLVMWRPPAGRPVVTARIRAVALDQTGGEIDPAQVAVPPSLMPQQVANAVRAADRLQGRGGAERSLPAAKLSEIAASIQIKPCPITNGGDAVQLTYVGQDPRWSVAFLHQLAQQLLVSRSGSNRLVSEDASKLRAAKWHVELARHYERKARYDMDDALRGQLQQPASAAPVDDQRPQMAGPPATAPSSETHAASSATIDALQSELAELIAKRAELMQTVQPTHPLARHLRQQIEHLQQRLLDESPPAATQLAQIESGTSADGSPSDPDFRQAAFAVPAEQDDQATGSTTYQRQRALYEQAVAEREQAEGALDRLLLHQHVGPPSALPTVWSMITPASVVSRVGEEMSGDAVAAIGLAAFVCGLLVFWRTSSLGELNEIDSVADLQATVSLPVVGRLSIDPPSKAQRRKASWGRLIRWSFRASELILITMFVLFLVSAITDGTVAGQFVDDPLGTFAREVALGVGR